jgi:hypothetical protein
MLMKLAAQGGGGEPSEKLLNAPWQKYEDGNRVSVGATLEQAESRIASNNYETGVLVDSNGFVVAAYKGGAHSVNFGNEPASLFQNATLTHNHPSGLPAFSVADIATPGIYALDGGKIKTVRATSVNGTFSLSAVSQSADWGKLATKYSNAEKKIRSKAVDAMTSAISQAKRQGKSHREVLRAGNKAGAKVYASWFKRAATKKSGFKFEYEE